MGMLSTLFREKVSKIKDPRMSRETEPDYQYRTGFLSFDYMNGVVVNSYNLNDIELIAEDGTIII